MADTTAGASPYGLSAKDMARTEELEDGELRTQKPEFRVQKPELRAQNRLSEASVE